MPDQKSRPPISRTDFSTTTSMLRSAILSLSVCRTLVDLLLDFAEAIAQRRLAVAAQHKGPARLAGRQALGHHAAEFADLFHQFVDPLVQSGDVGCASWRLGEGFRDLGIRGWGRLEARVTAFAPF